MTHFVTTCNLQVINDRFGIVEGLMTTVQYITGFTVLDPWVFIIHISWSTYGNAYVDYVVAGSEFKKWWNSQRMWFILEFTLIDKEELASLHELIESIVPYIVNFHYIFELKNLLVLTYIVLDVF